MPQQGMCPQGGSMRAEHWRWTLPLIFASLLAGCGTAAASTAQRGAAVAAATTRPLSVPPSHAVETATVSPSTPPSRTMATPTIPPLCAAISESFPHFASVATLAWVSHQIVAGMVVQRLVPIAIPLNPQDPASARIIYTDYVVRVDRQLRGFPAATVVVRRQGGTLDGCGYEDPNAPSLAVGDGVLFFLRESMMPNEPTPAYVTVGGPQGHWRLKPDGTVAPALTNAYPEAAGAQIADVATQVRAALSRPPPKSAPPQLVVPLDRAPLPPLPAPATPTRFANSPKRESDPSP
jgi:hypothetical protein